MNRFCRAVKSLSIKLPFWLSQKRFCERNGLKKKTKLMTGAVPTIQSETKPVVASEPQKEPGRVSNRMLLLQSSDKRPCTLSKTVHKLESLPLWEYYVHKTTTIIFWACYSSFYCAVDERLKQEKTKHCTYSSKRCECASSQVIQQLSVAVTGFSGLWRKKVYEQDGPEEPNNFNPWSCLIRATENRQSPRKHVQDIRLYSYFFCKNVGPITMLRN